MRGFDYPNTSCEISKLKYCLITSYCGCWPEREHSSLNQSCKNTVTSGKSGHVKRYIKANFGVLSDTTDYIIAVLVGDDGPPGRETLQNQSCHSRKL